MKKFILSIICIAAAQLAVAQVGVGTTNPDASAALEVQSTDKGLLPPRMTNAQMTAIATPATGLVVYCTDCTPAGLHTYNGTAWASVTPVSGATVGDVKQGFQTADHDGWVLLNGRSIASLTTSQQTTAISIGITGNLPQTSGNGQESATYLADIDGNAGTVGSIGGNIDNMWSSSDLPDLSHTHSVDPPSTNTSTNGGHNHSGTTSTTGAHSHDANVRNNASGANGNGFAASNQPITHSTFTSTEGAHAHTFTTNTTGDHDHSVNIPAFNSQTVNTGGANASVSTTNRTLDVNTFIYLGN